MGPQHSLTMSTPTIYYWGIRARAQLPILVARFSQTPLEWNRSPEWPGLKSQTAFGQLPFLVDGDVKVSQSGAIARYLARKANLSGSLRLVAVDGSVKQNNFEAITAWRILLDEEKPTRVRTL